MEHEATHTELTDEQDKRLNDLADSLAKVELSNGANIEFVLRVEQLIPDYDSRYGAWIIEDAAARAGITLQQYALELMLELEPTGFQHRDDLKCHVYAFGRLARWSTERSRVQAQKFWEQSAYFTTQ